MKPFNNMNSLQSRIDRNLVELTYQVDEGSSYGAGRNKAMLTY